MASVFAPWDLVLNLNRLADAATCYAAAYRPVGPGTKANTNPGHIPSTSLINGFLLALCYVVGQISVTARS